MICEEHNLKEEGYCSNCETYLCVQCMVEIHDQHLLSVTLKNNILIILHNILSLLKEVETIFRQNFPQNIKILKFIKEQSEIYNQYYEEIFQNNEVKFSSKIFIDILEKQVLKRINFIVYTDRNIGHEWKQKLKGLIEKNNLEKESELYVKITLLDKYYLLLMKKIKLKDTKIQG